MRAPPLESEQVACPLCGGGRFEPLARDDRYRMGLTTVGCTGCGLVMTNPQPTESSLENFYRHHYRHYYQKADRPDAEYIRRFRKDKRAAETADYLVRTLPAAPWRTVLDVGCAEGSTLRAIGQRRPGATKIGVEPGAAFADFAKEHAAATVYPDIASVTQALPPGSVDLVTMIHVLEHVRHPVAFLRDLIPLLSPQASLYVDVPDVAAYADLGSLHIAHLYHFSEATLGRTLSLAGYRLVHVESYQPVMHPRSIRAVAQIGEMDDAGIDASHSLRDWDRIRSIGRRAWLFHLVHLPETVRRMWAR